MIPFEKPIYVTQPMLPPLEEVHAKLKEIWESKWLSNGGKQHQLLEAQLKNVLKVPELSLFNNGTIALMVAIKSLELKGEVITTPFTFPATPHSLAWNGIDPVFCDIHPDTMTIDPNKIEGLITPRTTGILGVHVYGIPCHVEAIQRIADQYGLKVIYDGAHAFNTEIDGVGIGNFGDITMFSFHPTKLFHTAEGGALSFRDATLKSKIDLLKNFGIKNENEVVEAGTNGKLNEVQAAIGLVNLNYIEIEQAKRKNVLNVYMEELSNVEGISLLRLPENVRNSCQYFVIRIKANKFGLTRDEVYESLKQFNIFSRKYFYPLCSDYDCYRMFPSSRAENLIEANEIVKEVLCLPLYGALQENEARIICQIIKSLRKTRQ